MGLITVHGKFWIITACGPNLAFIFFFQSSYSSGIAGVTFRWTLYC